MQVIVVFDGRFWNRSPDADQDFWEGLRGDVLASTSRLTRLFECALLLLP